MQEKIVVEQINEARTLIDNTRKNQDIQKKMAAFGFGAKNLEQGKAWLEEVIMLQRLKKERYGRQYDGTDYLNAEQAAIQDLFEDHRALARIVFKNQRGMQTSLGLHEPQPKSRAQWSEQAANFYEKILEQQEAMGRFAVTRAELEQVQAMVTAFIDAQNQQVEKKGAAQSATRQRKIAQRKLRQWVSGFKAIARMALADDVALLEYLGIAVAEAR